MKCKQLIRDGCKTKEKRLLCECLWRQTLSVPLCSIQGKQWTALFAWRTKSEVTAFTGTFFSSFNTSSHRNRYKISGFILLLSHEEMHLQTCCRGKIKTSKVQCIHRVVKGSPCFLSLTHSPTNTHSEPQMSNQCSSVTAEHSPYLLYEWKEKTLIKNIPPTAWFFFLQKSFIKSITCIWSCFTFILVICSFLTLWNKPYLF